MFVRAKPPVVYPDPDVSSVPTFVTDDAPVPGVPTFVCVPEKVDTGDALMSSMLNTSPVKVAAVSAPVEATLRSTAVWETIFDTTPPAPAFVPVTAIPTAMPAVVERPVICTVDEQVHANVGRVARKQ